MPSLNTLTRTSFLIAMTTVLFACGSGGGGSSSSTNILSEDNNEENTGRNVALSSNGATVTSTFSGNETFVIDGDTSTDNFWAPGTAGDSVTVDLQQVFDLDTITVRNVGLNSTGSFRVELSDNGTDFETVNLPGDCSARFVLGSVFECSLIGQARYVRLTVLANVANVEVHEIEVTDFTL